MRRFSQRNSLVTLNDINITPLLDLAFVLLIIFVITTPLMEQSVSLKLPVGGSNKAAGRQDDVVMVESRPDGVYFIRGKSIGSDLKVLEQRLIDEYRRNTNMIVGIRADASAKYELPFNVLEICRRNGITRFSLQGEPPAKR